MEPQVDRQSQSSSRGDDRPRRTARFDDYGDYLKMTDVRDITGMGSSYLREAARGGWLCPAVVRFGRSIRIRRDVLRRLIEEGGDRSCS